MNKADDVIKLSYINSIRNLDEKGQPSLLRDLVDLYCETFPEKLNEIKTSLELCDFENVKRVAHSLKSSSANLGALHMSELLRRLEHFNNIDAEASQQSLVSQIEHEYILVRDALVAEANKS